MDPVEFFDHLANNSISRNSFGDQEWYTLFSSFYQEKQELYRFIHDQLESLKELEIQHDQANNELNRQMMDSYDILSNDIQQHQTALMTEKRHYQKEKEWIAKVRQFHDEKIKLNVGGQLFQTSLSTLQRDPQSTLAIMFGEPKTIQPDADHSYFIDRDGTYFRLVLNYLRDSKIPDGIVNNPKIMDELMQEARFYKLNDLLLLKWQGLPALTQQELYTLYPLLTKSHSPVLFDLSHHDLSHLDFSHYHIDPRSTFMGSNLYAAKFDQAHFEFDFNHRVNFKEAYLVGTRFPQEGTLYRVTGLDFETENSIF